LTTEGMTRKQRLSGVGQTPYLPAAVAKFRCNTARSAASRNRSRPRRLNPAPPRWLTTLASCTPATRHNFLDPAHTSTHSRARFTVARRTTQSSGAQQSRLAPTNRYSAAGSAHPSSKRPSRSAPNHATSSNDGVHRQ
jgi:hypothetical protein